MVFDTETTGLPPKQCDLSDSVAWERCRIVQIAWEIYEGTQLLSKYCVIVKPTNFKIPLVASNIHGITDEIAAEKGIPIEEVFAQLRLELPYISTLVAHNIRFDNNVVLSELHRYKEQDLIDEWVTKEQKCTMLMSKPPKGRWLKLADLYKQLVKDELLENLHQADVDVSLCAQCYFRLIEQ